MTPEHPRVAHPTIDDRAIPPPRRSGYQDVFETPLAPLDQRSAEELMRAGLEGAPEPLRRMIPLIHRRILLLRLGPLSDPGHVLGWQVEESSQERVILRARSPLADAQLLGERDDVRLRLTTGLDYRRPWAATLVWWAVGPLHRRIAPVLLERAARSGGA